MIEKSVLLDPAESVFGSHMDLIQDGTISVRSAADFKKFPPRTIDKLVADHTENCAVCGSLPYLRVLPGPRQEAHHLHDDSAVQDALRRTGSI